jgi:DNA-binding transcriptional MerR regulator
MSSPVACRLDFAELDKLNRIKRLKGFKNNSEVIKHLIQDYENEDKEIRQMKKLVERLEKKIDTLEDKLSTVNTSDQSGESPSVNDELIRIILRIVLRLAESNPRACATLKDELPELFER